MFAENRKNTDELIYGPGELFMGVIMGDDVAERKSFGRRRAVSFSQNLYKLSTAKEIIISIRGTSGIKSQSIPIYPCFEQIEMVDPLTNWPTFFSRTKDYSFDFMPYMGLKLLEKRLVCKPKSVKEKLIEEEHSKRERETERFCPSSKLIELFKRYADKPSGSEIEKIELLRKYYGFNNGDSELNEEEVSEVITDQLEGFFSNLARRTIPGKNIIKLTKNKKFLESVSIELIDRFDLMKDSDPVFEELCEELFIFADSLKRERGWGFITTKNSEIVLEVKESALDLPDIDDFEDGNWITLT